MPKFCPECGTELKLQKAKFCADCGSALKSEALISASEVNCENLGEEEKTLVTSVTDLGNKFEEVVERIFQTNGFRTERRMRMEGKSGTLSEIDIVANKLGKVVAVECKNHADPIGVDSVRDFAHKLQDLGSKWKGIFVSYSGFTNEASQLAQYENIETWDHDQISEKWLAIFVGRLTSRQGQFLNFKYALPLNVDFSQAIRVEHLNKNMIKISSVELICHPYFSIEYHFKAQVKDPTKKLHKFEDRGILYVDALDSHILNPLPDKGLDFLRKTVQSFISKNVRAQSERNRRLIQELRHSKSSREYSLNIDDDYTVIQLKPVITPHEAVRSCVDFIIDKNMVRIQYTPKDNDKSQFGGKRTTIYVPKRRNIQILHKDIVVVPRWSISFESFGTTFKKEILACSGTLLEDTLSYCPRHINIGALTISKKAVAVCEICGRSLCEDHVKPCPVCNKWLCEAHGADCEFCNGRFCSQHLTSKCSVCNKPICEACAMTCPICHGKYGRNHSVKCDQCGILVCSNCICTTGIIRKTRTCRQCTK